MYPKYIAVNGHLKIERSFVLPEIFLLSVCLYGVGLLFDKFVQNKNTQFFGIMVTLQPLNLLYIWILSNLVHLILEKKKRKTIGRTSNNRIKLNKQTINKMIFFGFERPVHPGRALQLCLNIVTQNIRIENGKIANGWHNKSMDTNRIYFGPI